MANLRNIIDGVGSLSYNIQPERVVRGFKVTDDVIIRRETSRSGPATSEVMVGTILALGETLATVSIKKGRGITEIKRDVPIQALSPVTLAFRRSSIQFQPAYRGRV